VDGVFDRFRLVAQRRDVDDLDLDTVYALPRVGVQRRREAPPDHRDP